MNREITNLIDHWFSGDFEDGDFIRADRCACYFVLAPLASSKVVYYFPKSSIAFAAAQKVEGPIDFGIISHSGLPNEVDVDWLVTAIGNRQLLFIGDLDPADIMIFAWLRDRLSSLRVTHLGINDLFLERVKVVVPRRYQIRMRSSEVTACVAITQTIPDLAQMLGPNCFQVLANGYKIEIEAIISSIGVDNAFKILLRSG